MQGGCSALPKLRAGSSATHLSPVEEINPSVRSAWPRCCLLSRHPLHYQPRS